MTTLFIKDWVKMSHKNIRNEPVALKIIRFGTQAIWYVLNIVPQNVLKQHILLPVMVILTKNNSIFPPNTCIN